MFEIGFEAGSYPSLIYQDSRFIDRAMVNTTNEAKIRLPWILQAGAAFMEQRGLLLAALDLTPR